MPKAYGIWFQDTQSIVTALGQKATEGWELTT